MVWVPYCCCAAVCWLSLPLLLLLLFCFCLCLCLLARVGVLGHRRGTAPGHPCGMPPTGANIAVLLLKTWLAPDSTYTWQPSVVRLSVGMMAVRAVLYCCRCYAAAAVRVACVCFHRGYHQRCCVARKCSTFFRKIKKYVLGKESAQVLKLWEKP